MSEPRVYPFMARRGLSAVVSGLLLVIALGSLVVQGLNFGLDFTGGALVEVGYEQPAELGSVRTQLDQAGFADARVQYFGSERDVMIRLAQTNNPQLGDQVVAALQADDSSVVTLRRSEFVGPQVGEELRDQGGLGMIIAVLVIMVYIALRFQLKFALGSVAALVHDVIIVLGVFSLFQLDFDLTVLAALLATIGYSLNDSIVVSDRIRENFRTVRRDDPFYIIDLSLTQTLGRTVITSLTTILVLLSLLVLGGEMIRMFALAMLIGVVVGTYSSIYVTTNTLNILKLTKQDLARPEKIDPDVVEGELEEIPDWLRRQDDS